MTDVGVGRRRRSLRRQRLSIVPQRGGYFGAGPEERLRREFR
jgi:hypothetical protein